MRLNWLADLMRLNWLADEFRAAGLTVVEEDR